MTKMCEISGKLPQTGNNVSHSNKKSKRRFLPNLQNVRLWSDLLQQAVPFRICVRMLKTVEYKGGLDAFLLGAKKSKLTANAQKLKKQLEKKQAEIKKAS